MPEPAGIGPLARRDGEAAFDEPWQAQVLALAFTLVEDGAFGRVEWSDALGAELRRAAARGDPDGPETYYAAALAALEGLLAAGGRITPAGLGERVEAWRRAYLHTPHGEPVVLAAAARDTAPGARER